MKEMDRNMIERMLETEYYRTVPCTDEDLQDINANFDPNNQETLPDGVVIFDGKYARYEPAYPSSFSFSDYLAIKQLEATKTIKKCVIFFVVITIVGFFFSFLLSMIRF